MGLSEDLLSRYLAFLMLDQVEPARHGLRVLGLKALHFKAFRASKGLVTASMVLDEEEVGAYLRPGKYLTRHQLEALSDRLREELSGRFARYRPKSMRYARNKRPWAVLFRTLDAARAQGLLDRVTLEAGYLAVASLKEGAARLGHTYVRVAGWHDLSPPDALDGLLLLLDVLTASKTALADRVRDRFLAHEGEIGPGSPV